MSVDILSEIRTWTPTQVHLFIELVNLAEQMHKRGASEAKILRAIQRHEKKFKKKLAQ